MKQLLEEMVWCWINDVIMQEFSGQPHTQATFTRILEEAQNRCLLPMREAGIIQVWKLSLNRNKNHLELFVDLTLPENIAAMAVTRLT